MRQVFPFAVASAVALCAGASLRAQDVPREPPALTSAAVAVVAEDVSATLHFYVDLLGLRPVDAFHIDESFGRRSGLSAGRPFDVTVLAAGEDAGAFQIKVVGFDDDPGADTPGPIQARAGVRYLTLYFSSISNILARLTAAGVPTAAETPFSLADGREFAVVHDPNGVTVELIGAAE